jgi:hypothetical protein
MVSLLNDVFRQHPEKTFLLVTAPPCQPDTPCSIELGRAIANWMVHDMLDGYDLGNVTVFDLFNVMTSKAEGEGDSCGRHDVGLATGNHHRLWNDHIQHQVQYNQLYTAYCWDHPTSDAYFKATVELVSLLNHFMGSKALPAPSSQQVRPARRSQI